MPTPSAYNHTKSAHMSQPSPSPSPAPQAQNGSSGTSGPSKASRQSLGPSVRVAANLSPLSPRAGVSAARPTSELLGSGSFQTPEGTLVYALSSAPSYSHDQPVEALDQWFENLQNYEATLVSVPLRSAMPPQLLMIPAFTLLGRDGRCFSRCQLQGRAQCHRAM